MHGLAVPLIARLVACAPFYRTSRHPTAAPPPPLPSFLFGNLHQNLLGVRRDALRWHRPYIPGYVEHVVVPPGEGGAVKEYPQPGAGDAKGHVRHCDRYSCLRRCCLS